MLSYNDIAVSLNSHFSTTLQRPHQIFLMGNSPDTETLGVMFQVEKDENVFVVFPPICAMVDAFLLSLKIPLGRLRVVYSPVSSLIQYQPKEAN